MLILKYATLKEVQADSYIYQIYLSQLKNYKDYKKISKLYLTEDEMRESQLKYDEGYEEGIVKSIELPLKETSRIIIVTPR